MSGFFVLERYLLSLEIDQHVSCHILLFRLYLPNLASSLLDDFAFNGVATCFQCTREEVVKVTLGVLYEVCVLVNHFTCRD